MLPAREGTDPVAGAGMMAYSAAEFAAECLLRNNNFIAECRTRHCKVAVGWQAGAGRPDLYGARRLHPRNRRQLHRQVEPALTGSGQSVFARCLHPAGRCGKPHARICEGESQMAELLDHDQDEHRVMAGGRREAVVHQQ
jgi:hypothetical protein